MKTFQKTKLICFFTLTTLLISTVSGCFTKSVKEIKTAEVKMGNNTIHYTGYTDQDITTVYPRQTNEVLNNPGMGWVMLEEPTYAGHASLGWSGDLPEVGNVSLSVGWGHIEKSENVYDWSNVDRVIDYWVSKGKKINFRLCTDVLYLGYTQEGMPEWLFSKYNIPYEEREADGRRFKVADISNPVYKEKCNRFLKAFAERYGKKDYVEVIEVRAYGLYGEWHSGYSNFGTLENRITTLQNIIRDWRDAWGDKLIVVSGSYEFESFMKPNVNNPKSYDDFLKWSAFDKVVQTPNATFRRDGIGGALKIYDGRMGADYFALNNRLPLLGEGFQGIDYYKQSEYTIDDVINEALFKWRINYMTVIGWVAQDFKNLVESSPELVAYANNKMGYRLLPYKLEYTNQVKPGETFTLDHDWQNMAMGRAWADYDLKITLSDKNGKEVFTATDTKFDPAIMNSGELHSYEFRCKIPENIPKDSYNLLISVVDKTGKEAIALPIAGNNGNKKYFIGKINIGDRTSKIEKEEVVEDFEKTKQLFEKTGSGKIEKSGHTVDGSMAAIGSGTGIFLKGTGVKLKNGHTYTVTYDYKTNTPQNSIKLNSAKYYYFGATSDNGKTFKGFYKWQDVSSKESSRTIPVSIPEKGTYTLAFGCNDADPIAIDKIKVTDMGNAFVEDFEGSDSIFKADVDTEIMDASDDSEKIISDMKSAVITNREKRDYDGLVSDAGKLKLEKNSQYIVSFRVKALTDVGPGGYAYVKTFSKTSGITETIGTWYELTDYKDVNKSFSFTTGDGEDTQILIGTHNIGSFSIDDITLCKNGEGMTASLKNEVVNPKNVVPSIPFTLPYRENFETGAFNGTLFYPGDCSYGHLTTDQSKTIAGKFSVWGYSRTNTTSEWCEFLWSDVKRMKLEANTTYKVTYKYKVIKAPDKNGYFYFVARKQGSFTEDKSFLSFNGKAGDSGVITTYATTGDSDKYYFIWGIKSNIATEIVLDDVVVEKSTEQRITNNIDFENGSMDLSSIVTGRGVKVTIDKAKVISGKYSAFGLQDGNSLWQEFMHTDNKYIKFDNNGKYRVSFDYKIIKTPVEGGYFTFFARALHTDSADKGFVRFTGNAGDKGTITSDFILADFDDYALFWDIYRSGGISIDNIKIEKIK